jgi:hypothetical protein
VRIRKQIYELTPNDLEKFPVWEFCLDEEDEEGQDEATIRPYTDKPDPAAGMFVVRALFSLADGTKLQGYLTPPAPQDRDDLGIIQPIITTENGQVNIWWGAMKPSRDELEKYYVLLDNKEASEIFPLKFNSIIEIEGGPVEGVVHGFLYLKKKLLSSNYIIEEIK